MTPPVPKVLQDISYWMGTHLRRPLGELDAMLLPKYDRIIQEEARRWITDGPILSADRRCAIYHQQYWFRLLSLLQEEYPTLVRIFGLTSFNREIGEPFLQDHPLDDWSLAFFGSSLPMWLKMCYQRQNRDLVLMLARLDEAYNRLIFAPHLPFLQSSDIASLEHAKLFLQPYVALVSEECDPFSLRFSLLALPSQDGPCVLPEIVQSNPRRTFFLEQKNGAFHYEEIDPFEHLCLQTLEEGAFLENLIELCNETSQERLIGWLYKWAQRQMLTLHRGS